ncbi:torsin-1A-interacting protein 2-like isoform X1 [Pseudochaenichthys georgianus]|uniref:torsin-1A-interacting protein 2-like isoform X1 n=1 Tax=Pseudochaenichthys georgianus TaxID=52239 RepID=UPI00146F2193|nr:torsin-1A-interacting protein 2-like isoform X1 [Pseudochaenichthys georgianus]
MAEQDPDHQHTAEGKEGETQSILDPDVLPCNYKQERDPDEKQNISKALNQPLSEEPPPTDIAEKHTEGGKEEETKAKSDQEVSSSDDKQEVTDPNKKAQLSEDPGDRIAPPGVGTPLQADEGSCGDKQPTSTAEEKSREHHTGEKRESETISPPPLSEGKDDRVDGPREESPDTNNTHPEAGDNDGSVTKAALAPEEEEDIPERKDRPQENIESIGPNTEESDDAEATVPVVKGSPGGVGIYLMLALAMLCVAMAGQYFYKPEMPIPEKYGRQRAIFLRQLEQVKTRFPNQREVLWNRSKIHLLKHLLTAQPTEPVSLILTAGHGAERTLTCLAKSLAAAFSTSLNASLNASVLHIDGAGRASQDSDQVKLDIDSKLQGAFEGDKPVAVINRFEELPPGSTLIFYRYCDHENAAYKKTCLIFTVLLGEEEEIPAEARLSTVEEMVDDHLQKKFLSNGHPVAFDRMDLDKYSGLWSRISHLILPVAAERRIELEGC